MRHTQSTSRGLVDAAMQNVEHDRVTDGPSAMRRLRMQLEARSG